MDPHRWGSLLNWSYILRIEPGHVGLGHSSFHYSLYRSAKLNHCCEWHVSELWGPQTMVTRSMSGICFFVFVLQFWWTDPLSLSLNNICAHNYPNIFDAEGLMIARTHDFSGLQRREDVCGRWGKWFLKPSKRPQQHSETTTSARLVQVTRMSILTPLVSGCSPITAANPLLCVANVLSHRHTQPIVHAATR